MFGVIISIFFLSCVHLSKEVTSNITFSCRGRPSGYYADVDSGCQLYHMCDGLGRQFSYSCPNTTLFQQRMLICDHWYMVNCSKSESSYSANLLIGQKNRPFVEDSEEHPYHRTPRPDLLSQPSAAERNIVYRTGRSQNFKGLSVVGVESDGSTGDGPSYNLPSYWSTEYSKDGGSTAPREKADIPARITPSPPQQRRPVAKAINFESNSLGNSIKPSKVTNAFLRKKDDTPVNFKSLFKATTPVFPTLEELSTTPIPIGDILQPPRISSAQVNFERDHRPSDNILQENKFVNIRKVNGNTGNNNKKMLESIREIFAIPDYEFPLEVNGRPGYSGEVNSFQANPLIVELRPKEHPV